MLWLRTATKLARVDTRARKLTFADEVVGEANEEEGKPSVDAQGKLLVPSSSGLYWQQNGRWRLVNVKHGLASNLIQCALEDREGTLWVGGSGTGLDRLTGVREWSAWSIRMGVSRELRSRAATEKVSSVRNSGLSSTPLAHGSTESGSWRTRPANLWRD